MASDLYPPDWPKCPVCGEPALDGHVTCGDVRCNEGEQRRLRQRAHLPYATWEGTMTILGVPLRCHVLNNGQRVINADDTKRLVEAMANPAHPDLDENDMAQITRFLRGAPMEYE